MARWIAAARSGPRSAGVIDGRVDRIEPLEQPRHLAARRLGLRLEDRVEDAPRKFLAQTAVQALLLGPHHIGGVSAGQQITQPAQMILGRVVEIGLREVRVECRPLGVHTVPLQLYPVRESGVMPGE